VSDWQGALQLAAVLDGLGEARDAALRAQGAALSPADAVAYLKAEVDRVLGDE
jgi:hypothetical protein